MSSRVVCEGSFVLPLLPSEAIELFTPLGERRWVPKPGADLPAGPSDDRTEPGVIGATYDPHNHAGHAMTGGFLMTGGSLAEWFDILLHRQEVTPRTAGAMIS
jgi:hypothetical protein